MRRLAGRLAQPYRDALGPDGVAFATPQLAMTTALLLAYGAGILLEQGRLGVRLAPIGFAMVLAVIGLTAGISLGWARGGRMALVPGVAPAWLGRVGGALLLLGVASMGLYLIRIGQIPLLMSSVEQGRVDAAERGGAALRVLSLMALPGAWLFVASAATTRRFKPLVGAVVVISIAAGLQALTANRSPAFQLVIVAVLIALLASGHQRLAGRGLVLLVALAMTVVLAAGAFGAFRLASAPLYGPPLPGRSVMHSRTVDYPRLTVVAIRGYAVVPAQNFAYTLQAVPALIGWRLGSTYLQPIVTILPGRQTTFDQDLKVALEQAYAGGGTVPSLLGEAYANFGPIGWLVVPFLIGALTSLLYRVAERRRTPALWALYAYAIFHACGSVLSGLFVASIFPFEAYLILGLAAFVEWYGLPSGLRDRPRPILLARRRTQSDDTRAPAAD